MFLGLSGAPGSGKGAFTHIACREFGFRPISLSLAIKMLGHQLVGREFPDSEKDWPSQNLDGKTPRDLYVHIGSLNKFIPDLWVRRALADQYFGPDIHYVVDSVGNQAQWNALRLRATADRHATRLIEISRPGYEWIDNREPVSDAAPVIYLANNGSLAVYAAKCRRILGELLGERV